MSIYNAFRISLIIFLVVIGSVAIGQKAKKVTKDPVYVDKEGVMRWTSNKKEAAFFGVNYTTPFAYAYRAHKALNVDLEEAIRQDVYHLARLGLDAFRVHVWDTEISDVEGNLLENDHLRLYDFLLAELKKRNIKTIITPIAFWGNGYPERDEDTPGFSRYYGRRKLTTNDSAIVAQEKYLKQFFQHVNPYTRMSYADDPDVIAVEINNEPAHSGPKSGVTDYINRLTRAIKSTGWTKPVFYNISQGPYYADAVAASEVNGFSFQWYPTGLVAGHTLKGNYLPNVDQYTIPFDTIPAYHNKARMVYEFDAADIFQSCMYPAMARSFRQAGFQWATQFAYDPLAIAYANTEYQTHYLNLAYTPSKAISMLIASNVFHRMPRLKNVGAYPANSSFDVFRVSYEEDLSEMNTLTAFYYSNNTTTKPVDSKKLEHIAGVGNSPVVQYEGTGAYFLDKIEPGVWRLEVMPDAVHIRDPFERASPKKEVTRVVWNEHNMKIALPELGNTFTIQGLNEGNSHNAISADRGFSIRPGTYLLTTAGRKFSGKSDKIGVIGLNEFVAPKSVNDDVLVYHQPAKEVTTGKGVMIEATVVGIDNEHVSLLVSRSFGRDEHIPMKRNSAHHYLAEIPAEMVTPGELHYRILVGEGDEAVVFPGNIQGNPYAWDNTFRDETWTVYVAGAPSVLELFNPSTDRSVRTWPTFRRNFQTNYITGKRPRQLVLQLSATEASGFDWIGFQYSFVEKLKGRKSELKEFDHIVIRARSVGADPVQAKLTLVDSNTSAASSAITLTNDFQDIRVPIGNMKSDAAMLMPRPYPGFLPLTFKRGNGYVRTVGLEKVELTVPTASHESLTIEVECIWLEKSE